MNKWAQIQKTTISHPPRPNTRTLNERRRLYDCIECGWSKIKENAFCIYLPSERCCERVVVARASFFDSIVFKFLFVVSANQSNPVLMIHWVIRRAILKIVKDIVCVGDRYNCVKINRTNQYNWLIKGAISVKFQSSSELKNSNIEDRLRNSCE